MKKIILLLLFSAILLSSCKDKDTIDICNCMSLETPTVKDDLEYEVISSILNNFYLDLKYRHIVQIIHSKDSASIEYLKKDLKADNIKIDSLVFVDFYNKNKKTHFLSDRLNRYNIKVISDSEFRCLLDAGRDNDYLGWDNYYRKYKFSNGILLFSRPGFNASKDKAIIKYAELYGIDGREWYLVVLEKRNNKWEIIHHILD